MSDFNALKHSVDQAVLKLTGAWQKALIANLRSEPAAELAQLPLVILVLHLWEARLRQFTLQKLCEQDDLANRLSDRWQAFCEQTDRRFLKLLPSATCPDALLKSILGSLYYPKPDQFLGLSAGILGLVYEQSLGRAARSRKSGGIYYTPQPIVEYVIRSTLGAALTADIPQVLDLACGGGAFLLAAYQYLLERSKAVDRSPQFLLAHIHGVDIDPTSVAITQISLWLQSIEILGNNDQSHAILLKLEKTIRCGNAIIDCESNLAGFNWQNAFPEIIADGGFDLVIGNPPYLDAERMTIEHPDWRTYCAQHYKTATGNWDLFCVFIEKALQLCRPGGLISLVVPNKLLSASYAAATRQLLSQSSRLKSIRDYADVALFDAAIYPIVYVTQKSNQSYPASLYYEKMIAVEQVGKANWMQIDHPTQPWLVTDSSLMRRLDQLPKLGDALTVVGAATVAEAYALTDLLQNCPRPQPADLRLVNSGTIDRYRGLWGQKRLRYLGQTYQHPIVAVNQLHHLPLKRLHQARQTKIIVAGMSLRLECMLDPSGSILAGKSTSVLMQADAVDLRYWLGLLNSRLLSFYLLTRFGGNRLQGGYLRIGPPQLRQLPIVIPALDCPSQLNECETMIKLVDQRIEFDQATEPDRIRAVDAKVDAIVYRLYQLSATEIQQVEALVIPGF
jgi:SAM-dependent methyltransferase